MTVVEGIKLQSKEYNGMLASTSKLPDAINKPFKETLKKAIKESELDIPLMKHNNKKCEFSHDKKQEDQK